MGHLIRFGKAQSAGHRNQRVVASAGGHWREGWLERGTGNFWWWRIYSISCPEECVCGGKNYSSPVQGKAQFFPPPVSLSPLCLPHYSHYTFSHKTPYFWCLGQSDKGQGGRGRWLWVHGAGDESWKLRVDNHTNMWGKKGGGKEFVAS